MKISFLLLLTSVVAFVATIISVVVQATPTDPVTQSVDSWPRYFLATSTPSDFTNPANLRVTSDLSSLRPNEQLVIEGRYNPALFQTGWHFLQIDTTTGLIAKNAASSAPSASGFFDTQKEFYAAGFLEGYLTYVPMKQKSTSTAWNTSTTDAGVGKWVLDQISFMRTQSAANAATDLYWNRVSSILQQMQGCADGYNAAVAVNKENKAAFGTVDFLDVFARSFARSFRDVQTHINQVKAFEKTGEYPARDLVGDLNKPRERHCSASAVATKSEFAFSHVTWSRAESMLRVWKIYTFINVTVSMSSHPANFYSQDDFYETSNGLAVWETSLVVWNLTMYNVFPSSTVSEFIRTMVANYIATDALEWPTIFIKYNDGTYNNEYACVDYKKIDSLGAQGPSGANHDWIQLLPPNTLTFVDQLPGFYRIVDATDLLKQNRYFASYNIPSSFDAYWISGNQWQPQPFWAFNYTTSLYARPKIFRALAPKAETVADIQIMMRWNKFETDPNSRIMNCSGTTNNVCNPTNSAMLAIAARGDLNPPGGAAQYGPNYLFLGLRDHEGIDAKISTYSFWKNAKKNKNSGDSEPVRRDFPLSALAISGPTNDNQPTYKFSTAPIPNWPYKTSPPEGMPDEWNFPWIQIVASSSSSGSSDNSTGEVLGYLFGAIGIIVLISVIWFVLKNREKKFENEGGKYSQVEPRVQ